MSAVVWGLVSASAVEAGIVVGNPADTVVGSPTEVTLDAREMMPAEGAQLADLAGGTRFVVVSGWEVGAAPGQRSGAIRVEDVDVTSRDGRSFTLYVVEPGGNRSSLDVYVEGDGSLSVYDPATDSLATFLPAASQSQADGSKKKKKKKKKKGPKQPKPEPEPEPEPELEFDDECDCDEGEVCIESSLGGFCYEPMF